MADDKKSTQPLKGDIKMVPEADLLAIKKRAERLEGELTKVQGELAETKGSLAQTKDALRIAKTDAEDDEEVKKVKDYLLEEANTVRAEREKLNKDLASAKEREREVGAKELALKYGVSIDDIKGEPTMESMKIKALEIHAEKLVREREEKSPTQESIYETGQTGMVKKQPKDMDEKEFADYLKKQKQEALSKK